MIQKIPLLVVGAGLAGLSASYHSRKKTLIVEKTNTVGGTARSFKVGQFTFDVTGHLLHLHNPYTRKLVTRLLGKNFFSCKRNTAIHLEGREVNYPFQASVYGLNDQTVDACVLGFLDAYMDNQKRRKNFHKMDFETWSREIFGDGISDHFMVPYNQKLFQIPPHKMTVDWCGGFVPRPEISDVVKGALTPQEKGFGYNQTFLYPKKGGIQVLSEKLAERAGPIQFNAGLDRVDLDRKEVLLSDGSWFRYDSLVNTIPLDAFLDRAVSLPPPIKKARINLRRAGVLCLNIGVKRARISRRSWIYFPEKKFPFYRVGFPMNFTPHVVPKGCSSMYVEVPFTYLKGRTKNEVIRNVKKGLFESGICRPSDKFLEIQYLPVPHAYVVYDFARESSLKTIFSFLEKKRVQSVGRYGAWKYSFMEEAILDGKKAAEAFS